MPESYNATARIKAEPEVRPQNQGAQSQSSYSPSYDPYFIQTEFAVIQSELILGPVIDRLKLKERWGKRYTEGQKLTTAETIQILLKGLDLRPVRNTSLIEIGVWSPQPKEAAEIANSIAEEFRGYHIRQHETLVRHRRGYLETGIKDQESQIAEVQATLDRLRKALNITDEKARQTVESATPTPEEQPFWSKRRELEDLL
jgi:uncharacterized protein involved in exopolysaccharide biosynthesis